MGTIMTSDSCTGFLLLFGGSLPRQIVTSKVGPAINGFCTYAEWRLSGTGPFAQQETTRCFCHHLSCIHQLVECTAM